MSTFTRRLEVADTLLHQYSIQAEAIDARAIVWLLRIGVEQALDDLWRRHNPQVLNSSRRAQLLCLRALIGVNEAIATAALWSALSHAAHYHDYELAPSYGELRRWRHQTAAVLASLSPSAHNQ